jgi:hypothetical protein
MEPISKGLKNKNSTDGVYKRGTKANKTVWTANIEQK